MFHLQIKTCNWHHLRAETGQEKREEKDVEGWTEAREAEEAEEHETCLHAR